MSILTQTNLVPLISLLPPDRLFWSEDERANFTGDKWARGPLPDVVARPHTTEEVAIIAHFCFQQNIPLTTRGAGWGYVGGAIASQGGVLLSLDAMNRILDISRTDFVAHVEAGALTGDIARAVREVGLFYPPDPASLDHCTIGGNIATNAGGPHCLKYGVTRSYVLGLEVVLMDGTVLRLGGDTHKNKTGFDLLGLFVGSEGMLGIVTQATLRLLPHPRARRALAAHFANIEVAAKAIGAILESGVLPCALEVADAATLRHFRAAQGQIPRVEGSHLLVEVDGLEESVSAEAQLLSQILRSSGALGCRVATTEAQVEELWQMRRSFSASLSATGGAKLNEDIVVPRGKLVELVAFAEQLGRKHSLEVACFGHAGDGNIHVNLLLDTPLSPQEAGQRAQPALDELFAQILSWGGAITGEHGIGLAKARWWPGAVSPEVRHAHAAIKTALDPKALLNPGKWLE
ncbi:putative FAD-linked oxidoreductase [Abditibacteriota bacterium]|nr:putative FAD-linked oxidoreductase [Abditibacteriota bacterium]